MNTKFFILLLISLLIAIVTSPASNPKKEHSVSIQKTESSKPANDYASGEELPIPGEGTKDIRHWEKAHRPNSEEDGKHHHFHYTRLKGRRRFLLFLSKFILAIVHISCFIYCFLHPFH